MARPVISTGIIWTFVIIAFTVIVWRGEHPKNTKQCHFCNEWREIHPDSDAQYGEPVCWRCYEASYRSDP